MIIPMQKYSFLIYHKEYGNFLKELQKLGVIHVIEKEIEISEKIKVKYQSVNQIDKIIKSLEKLEVEKNQKSKIIDAIEIIGFIKDKQEEQYKLKQDLIITLKEIEKTKPWGEFNPDTINKLRKENINLRYFVTYKSNFKSTILSDFDAEIISESENLIYFIIIQQNATELDIDAEEIKQPKYALSTLYRDKEKIENDIQIISNELDTYA